MSDRRADTPDRAPDGAPYVLPFADLGGDDVPQVGGKNASLGEMIRELGEAGVRVPGGFATTARAYRRFLEHGELNAEIRRLLEERESGGSDLESTGAAIRDAIRGATFPDDVAGAVRHAYRDLAIRQGRDEGELDVAARSSATAEDLPEASFAGQQETYLNVRGADAVLDACRRCYASLFTDRAIAYREEQGFGHLDVALSVGVQVMVRADRAGSGVLFTLDTDTGFPDTVLINAAWGLGETVVQGTVEPDQYTVFKPFLATAEDGQEVDPILEKRRGAKERKRVYAEGGETEDVETSDEERASLVLDDAAVLRLARWGVAIEEHYGRPMDVEWARDEDGTLHVVQARPETVQSQRREGHLETYRLLEDGEALVTGLAIGGGIGAGTVRVIRDLDEAERLGDGEVLVTGRTDPDWVPLMQRAAGIVTDRGGRTSHAAIVSRELGVPAVIGCDDATATLEDGAEVTLSCAGEPGTVYRGELDFERREIDLSDVPDTATPVLMNVASPAAALRWWRLPVQGIGLARIESLISQVIRVHPLALLRPDEVADGDERRRIAELTAGRDDPAEYFVDHLARGVATIAASRWPDPVLVRTSDFKSNEYADLLGGAAFEPSEENPMLGWRGASRYTSDDFRDAFALECRALARARRDMGFTNVVLMIPFCRTPQEADGVLALLAEHGLVRGEDGLQVYVMAEIPSNVLRAAELARRFDGFSIGSNDLTQLTLGVGRDAERLSHLFDERDPAVRELIRQLIATAHEHHTPVGICGQAPSDHPDYAGFLVRAGIDTLSVNPDSVLDALEHVAAAEAELTDEGEERS